MILSRGNIVMAKHTCWVSGCRDLVSKWGMCGRHRKLWLEYVPRKGVNLRGRSLEERFWFYIQKGASAGLQEDFGAQPDCWPWTGALEDGGYGAIGVDRSFRRTHLVSLELVGRLPAANQQADHLCRFRPCGNPAHLESVSQQINVLRGEGPAATSAKRDRCGEGHLLEGANLVIEDRKRPDGTKREVRRCRTCVNAKARGNHKARKTSADGRFSDEECRNGHPRTKENTVMRGDVRRCRVCLNEASKESYHRTK